MSYLRPQLGMGRSRGLGGALGDTASSDPMAALVAQVNRFGPDAPSGYQFVSTPFSPPPNFLGVSLLPISTELATTALTIYQRRATDGYNQFHDAGSQQAINDANAGFADPVAFVTSHLADVTATLQGYADWLKIAPAAVPDAGALPTSGGSSGTLVLAGAILLGWWLLEDRK